jgi:hypothetical protein
LAYLYFKTEDDLVQFKHSFNNHAFITEKGKEKRAEVDYAPFQGAPRGKAAPDPKANTIENGMRSNRHHKTTNAMTSLSIDPDYLRFVEDLKKPIQTLPSAEEQLDARLAQQKEQQGKPFRFSVTSFLTYFSFFTSNRTQLSPNLKWHRL